MAIRLESYKHLYAKRTLFEWLSNAEKESPNNDYCNFAQFGWRKNYGVYMELKFRDTSDVYFFENGDSSGKILFSPDITVFQKGTPIYIFEIFHTHRCDADKIALMKEFFKGTIFEAYEVSAEYILRQTSVPKYIMCEQII